MFAIGGPDLVSHAGEPVLDGIATSSRLRSGRSALHSHSTTKNLVHACHNVRQVNQRWPRELSHGEPGDRSPSSFTAGNRFPSPVDLHRLLSILHVV